MKVFRGFLKILPFALSIFVLCAVAYFPQETVESEEVRFVRVWNVDTFEGGKGSRTTFLKKVATRVEKSRSGVYYTVSSYTETGAREALKKGDLPDLLSFGIGLDCFAEYLLPLPYSFAGGEIDGKTLAYPWCRGGYALFSLTDNFEEEGKVAISCGGSNLSLVSAAVYGIEGEELSSTEAYTGFLSGKYRYLLGTQRDRCRLASRNVTVFTKPLSAYCDLYQVVSVLSESKWEDCTAFLEELLSEETQGELSTIGMYSLAEQDGFLGTATESTLSVFTSSETLSTLRQLARSKTERTNLVKYFKSI